jgi:hypothetical protein
MIARSAYDFKGPPAAKKGMGGRNLETQWRLADALNKVHLEAATRTRTALARVTAAAAEEAAANGIPLPVRSTAQLRELTAAASRVFRWDENKGPSTVHNTLVITSEQLQQIRALREPVVYEAPRLEGPPQPFPASSGSVGHDVKVTP